MSDDLFSKVKSKCSKLSCYNKETIKSLEIDGKISGMNEFVHIIDPSKGDKEDMYSTSPCSWFSDQKNIHIYFLMLAKGCRKANLDGVSMLVEHADLLVLLEKGDPNNCDLISSIANSKTSLKEMF